MSSFKKFQAKQEEKAKNKPRAGKIKNIKFKKNKVGMMKITIQI